jgi:GrpB-like predicted nucleotidyltransferase (UPF0157 family)
MDVNVDTLKRGIEIVPYKSSWLDEFSKIGSILRLGMGNLAIRIDHIGSTSVPGLAAKDIIDIQVTVVELDEQAYSAMVAIGYTRLEHILRDHCPTQAGGGESEWEKWLFKPPPYQRRTNTHMRVLGRANQRYSLLFRDYLRAHPATAESYAELKRRLAQHLANPETYPDVKDPAVDLIYLAAEEWATAIHWEPGKSDA